MAKSLTFAIHPTDDSLWLQTLEKTIEDVRKLIKEVDLAVTRERRGRPWIVTRLQSSTPTITIQPAINGTKVVNAFADGLRVLTAEQEPVELPIHYSEEALDTLLGMRKLFKGKYRLGRVVFSTDDEPEIAVIREDIQQKIERVFRGGYKVLGSLEGTLEALNMRIKPPAFTIWERTSGRPVRCSFTKEHWLDQVVTLLRGQKRAIVTGTIGYFHNGQPRYIKDIREIRDMTPDTSLPKAKFGGVPGLSGGRDTAEYLSLMRE